MRKKSPETKQQKFVMIPASIASELICLHTVFIILQYCSRVSCRTYQMYIHDIVSFSQRNLTQLDLVSSERSCHLMRHTAVYTASTRRRSVIRFQTASERDGAVVAQLPVDIAISHCR